MSGKFVDTVPDRVFHLWSPSSKLEATSVGTITDCKEKEKFHHQVCSHGVFFMGNIGTDYLSSPLWFNHQNFSSTPLTKETTTKTSII